MFHRTARACLEWLWWLGGGCDFSSCHQRPQIHAHSRTSIKLSRMASLYNRTQRKNCCNQLEKVSWLRIEVRPTALHPYSLDIDLWPWHLTLTFNPKRAMVMTPSHTRKLMFKGQSVQKMEWKQTNRQTGGQTDATDWCTTPKNIWPCLEQKWSDFLRHPL